MIIIKIAWEPVTLLVSGVGKLFHRRKCFAGLGTGISRSGVCELISWFPAFSGIGRDSFKGIENSESGGGMDSVQEIRSRSFCNKQ